jgi:riboflavin transporter FmnP
MLIGFSIGTTEGIYVILLKNFLYILFSGKGFSDFGIGIFMSTFAGIIMVFFSSKIYLYNPTKKMAIVGLSVATIAMTVLMLPLNYLVLHLLPFIFPNLREVFSNEKTMLFIWAGAFPFNMIKGIITSIITVVIYKRISAFLKETGKLR